MRTATGFASYFGNILRAPELGAGPSGGGGGAAAPGGAGGGGSDAPPSGGAADWSAHEGLKDYAPIIESKGWKGQPIDKVLPEVFKSYNTLEKAVGNNVPVPGKDAKPEDWDGVYAKLGRPNDFKEYKLPEAQYTDGDRAFQAAVLPAVHKAGLSQRQLDVLAPVWNEAQTAQRKSLDTTATKFHETSTAALKEHFKGEEGYKTGLELGTRAFTHVFGEAAGELLEARLADGRYLRHIPGLIIGMSKLGAQLQESGALDGNPPDHFRDAGGNKAEAQKELDAIYKAAGADTKHAYANPQHPEHQAMQDKVFKLTQIIAGAG